MADETRIRHLTEQLRDFRTRRQARLELVRMGEPAVDPLIELLADRDEALVWCAIQSLEELADPRAVAPLIDLMRRSVLPIETADALSRITGESFGPDADQWAAWAEKTPQAGMVGTGVAGAETLLVAPQDLLQRVVDGTDMTVTPRGENFRVTVPLKHDRRQQVDVLFNLKDPEGDDLVCVYSECGPANAEYYDSVLRRNLRVPHGAYGIRDVGGEPTFVMFNTMLRRSAGVEHLRKVIASIAKRADAVEKAITAGGDER